MTMKRISRPRKATTHTSCCYQFLLWFSLFCKISNEIANGEKTSVDIYRRLKNTDARAELSLYLVAPDGSRLWYQAPLDFHAELKKDSTGVSGFINNIDPTCWISSFLILDQARSLTNNGAGVVEILNNSTDECDEGVSAQNLQEVEQQMLITKPGKSACAILDHHERKLLALEMTRCYMEEHKYMFQTLTFHSVNDNQETESFDASQCHDSNAIYSSPLTLQKCVQHMEDVGFLTYTQLLILLDGICSRWSRPLWDYVVMDSTMKVLEMFQSLEQQQSRQNLSQMLINATEQLLLQSSSLPNEDFLVINEHERIRKAYQRMTNILAAATRLKKTLVSVVQWYALLKLSGTIPLIHNFSVLCAISISFVAFVFSMIYRCLFGVSRKNTTKANCKDDKNMRESKKIEEQILLNQLRHQEELQAHLQQWVTMQSYRKQADDSKCYSSILSRMKHSDGDFSSRMTNNNIIDLLGSTAFMNKSEGTVHDEQQPLRIEPKASKSCEYDVKSKRRNGQMISCNYDDYVPKYYLSKTKTQKKSEADHPVAEFPVTIVDSLSEKSRCMPIISPERSRQLAVEGPASPDCAASVDSGNEYLSMEEFDDSTPRSFSTTAGSLKRLHSEASGQTEIGITCKRQKI